MVRAPILFALTGTAAVVAILVLVFGRQSDGPVELLDTDQLAVRCADCGAVSTKLESVGRDLNATRRGGAERRDSGVELSLCPTCRVRHVEIMYMNCPRCDREFMYSMGRETVGEPLPDDVGAVCPYCLDQKAESGE